MLARKRSLVSCRVWCAGSLIVSFHSAARMEVTAGLHTSQPLPLPYWWMRSSNVFSCLAWTMANSSVREYGKCSHRWWLMATPAAAMAPLNRSVTSGMQPPQPVPARVAALRSAREMMSCARMASQMAPLVTLLQEQICVASAMASTPTSAPAPPEAPRISALGRHGSGSPLLASTDRVP